MSNDPADDDPPSGVAPDGDPHGDPTNDHPTSSDPANDDPANDDPANDDPANDDPANDEAEPAVVAAGPRSGPRHAASGAGLRLQPWMLAVAAVIVIGLLAWLIIALTTGDDSDPAAEQSSQSTSSAATSSAAPTPVDPVSLPQVLCMGQSYAMLETGQTAEQLLADPGAVEAQYPGSKLSTIPPGCIAGSDTRDQVVLALGPFPSLQEACTAGGASGVTFAAYEGSADMGLKAATCPPE